LLGLKPMLASVHAANVPAKPCPFDNHRTICPEDWETRQLYVIGGTAKPVLWTQKIGNDGLTIPKRIFYIDSEGWFITASDQYDSCRLKADADTAEIPVIMITARDDMDARAEGMRLGVSDFLAKPVFRRQLANRIRAQLDAGAAGRSASETLNRFDATIKKSGWPTVSLARSNQAKKFRRRPTGPPQRARYSSRRA
jgi:hypothetical protein